MKWAQRSMEMFMVSGNYDMGYAVDRDIEDALRQLFEDRLKQNVPLARYTSARLGGPAEFFLEAVTADRLADIVSGLWQLDLGFHILGGGSNVLISDAGIPGVVVLNRARPGSGIRFEKGEASASVWAESGVNFGSLARQAAQMGFSGLEWAAGIPGTLGGAVVGNAGAHGADMRSSLLVAEILQRDSSLQSDVPGRVLWQVEDLAYAYRSSRLKREPGDNIVLGARLRLEKSEPGQVMAKIDELNGMRRRTQPPGASMGSMFKNPPGDYAGRLIEAAGLKGARIGDAQISSLHGNFFINLGRASAGEVLGLIRLAQATVEEKFGVHLELEIELLGNFEPGDTYAGRQSGRQA
jgi:UDP-N-acetylmuramate dehydrogenase